MTKVIEVQDLSKIYHLGDFNTGTLARDIERFLARIMGKEDPFLKVGELNDRTQQGKSNIVWSLKDLNFEIGKGDAVGIIGSNGAGKSTLLKILSRVTAPTNGAVKIKGRLASLLEVGTGFHPELTGRENVFLNGAILGMRKSEIKRKFDEIVDFAGVERYVDTPVKRYSSGMYVRLAFAVAAHLESEILVIDEVLAVGDAEFQKKCLGKMGDLRTGEGRTLLFVSHNMASIAQLCNKGILLDKGQLIKSDFIKPVINAYLKSTQPKRQTETLVDRITLLNSAISVSNFTINGSAIMPFDLLQDNWLAIKIEGFSNHGFQMNLELRLYTAENVLISFYSPAHMNGELRNLRAGNFSVEDKVELPERMANGTYYLEIALSYPNVESYLLAEGICLNRSSLQTITGRGLNYNDIGFFLLKRYEA